MAAVQQAGAIVVRLDGTEPRVLLVTAKRDQSHWIFPKGHVEEDETLDAAAVREAHEESGVRGTVFGRAGSASYRFEGDTYRVRYVLMATCDKGRAEAGRRFEWCSFRQALDRLAFNNLREVLQKAWPQIVRHASGVQSTAAASRRDARGRYPRTPTRRRS